jgi:hypothetical protein
MHVRESLRPELPPGFELVDLAAPADAMTHACGLAAGLGAGTLVTVRRADVAEFAVVLEPDEPLRLARRAFFAGMVALGNAIASCAPPEKRIGFDWPGTVLFDGARLGGARLCWPEQCTEAEIPAWLVFAAMLIASKADAGDPGLTPDSTSLEEECCGSEDHHGLVQSFARQLMRISDEWRYSGFEPVEAAYLSRLEAGRQGHQMRLADKGDLLDARQLRGKRHAFVPALREACWFDRASGKPRL